MEQQLAALQLSSKEVEQGLKSQLAEVNPGGTGAWGHTYRCCPQSSLYAILQTEVLRPGCLCLRPGCLCLRPGCLCLRLRC